MFSTELADVSLHITMSSDIKLFYGTLVLKKQICFIRA
jgi:hypothetical protein